MKINITKPDGTVSWVFDTNYLVYSIGYMILLVFVFASVWSLAFPIFLYDIMLSVVITTKIILYIRTKRSRKK